MGALLTIFTPTYNRSHLLDRLYESLCKQINKDFIWLVINDGSTDDTAEKLEKWKDNSPFQMKFITKKNGGKHSAHNLAVSLCETPFFMVIDSDDILTSDAVELIYKYWEEDTDGQGILIGWGTRKGDLEGNPVNCTNWDFGEPLISLVDLVEGRNFRGEMALILKTDLLKKYLYPIIPTEKFVTEIIALYELPGKIRIRNDIFYLFEYQNDGYTNQGLLLKIKNPIGTAIEYKLRSVIRSPFKTRFIYLIKYEAWKNYFGLSEREIDEYFKELDYGKNVCYWSKFYHKIAQIVACLGKWWVKQYIENKRNI